MVPVAQDKSAIKQGHKSGMRRARMARGLCAQRVTVNAAPFGTTRPTARKGHEARQASAMDAKGGFAKTYLGRSRRQWWLPGQSSRCWSALTVRPAGSCVAWAPLQGTTGRKRVEEAPSARSVLVRAESGGRGVRAKRLLQLAVTRVPRCGQGQFRERHAS